MSTRDEAAASVPSDCMAQNGRRCKTLPPRCVGSCACRATRLLHFPAELPQRTERERARYCCYCCNQRSVPLPPLHMHQDCRYGKQHQARGRHTQRVLEQHCEHTRDQPHTAAHTRLTHVYRLIGTHHRVRAVSSRFTCTQAHTQADVHTRAGRAPTPAPPRRPYVSAMPPPAHIKYK